MSEFSRGRLVVIEGDLANSEPGTLEFMFNPAEYTISKQNQWTVTSNKGRNVPKYEFAGGNPRTVQIELFFNSYLFRPDQQQRDLRLVLNKLFNMMLIDPGMKGVNSHMSHPPKCRLEWGQYTKHLAFPCYIINCSIKFTMFNEQGIPIRATATLQLQEAMDSEALLPTNPTSRGEPGRKLRTIQDGDRLDWIAYEEYGSALEWRRIAEANKLYNPLELRAGMVLAIPPR